MVFTSLVPELSVSDHKKSHAFYVGVLGFREDYRREEKGFYYLSLGGAQLMIEQTNGHWSTGPLEKPYGRGLNFEISVDRIGPLVENLSRAGISLFRSPEEAWYRAGDHEVGQRQFLVQDPDGYLLRFVEPLGTREVQL